MLNKFKIFSSKGFRSSAIVAFGNIGGTAISALAMIMISRSLGPLDFGVFSAAFSVMTIATRLGDLGINLAFQRHLAREQDPSSDTTISTVFLSKLIVSALLIILALSIGPYINNSLTKFDSANTLIAVLIFSIGVIFYEYSNIIIQAIQNFFLYSFSVIGQGTLKLIIISILIFSDNLTALSSIIVYGLSPLMVSMAILSYSRINLNLASISKKTLSKDWAKLWSAAKWTSISVIAASVADNLDVLVIKYFLTDLETGLWSAAIRIATFASLIHLSLGTVLNVRVAKYRDEKNLKSYLAKAKKLSLLSFLLIILLIPLSPLLLGLTVGQQYLDASRYLNILLFSTAITAATSPFVALFFSIDRPQYFAISGTVLMIVLISLDFVLIPQFGTIGAGYARIITRTIIFIFTIFYARKYYRSSFSPSIST